jgi:hypothetical protein
MSRLKRFSCSLALLLLILFVFAWSSIGLLLEEHFRWTWLLKALDSFVEWLDRWIERGAGHG